MNIDTKAVEALTASSKRDHGNVAVEKGSHHGNKTENPATSKGGGTGSPLRKVRRTSRISKVTPRKEHIVRVIEQGPKWLEEDGGNAHQLLFGLYKKMTGNDFQIPGAGLDEFIKSVVRNDDESTKGIARIIMEIADSDIGLILEQNEKLNTQQDPFVSRFLLLLPFRLFL